MLAASLGGSGIALELLIASWQLEHSQTSLKFTRAAISCFVQISIACSECLILWFLVPDSFPLNSSLSLIIFVGVCVCLSACLRVCGFVCVPVYMCIILPFTSKCASLLYSFQRQTELFSLYHSASHLLNTNKRKLFFLGKILLCILTFLASHFLLIMGSFDKVNYLLCRVVFLGISLCLPLSQFSIKLLFSLYYFTSCNCFVIRKREVSSFYLCIT